MRSVAKVGQQSTQPNQYQLRHAGCTCHLAPTADPHTHTCTETNNVDCSPWLKSLGRCLAICDNASLSRPTSPSASASMDSAGVLLVLRPERPPRVLRPWRLAARARESCIRGRPPCCCSCWRSCTAARYARRQARECTRYITPLHSFSTLMNSSP